MAQEKVIRSDLSGDLVDGHAARITVRLSDSTTYVLDASDDEARSFATESNARAVKARGRRAAVQAAPAPAAEDTKDEKVA